MIVLIVFLFSSAYYMLHDNLKLGERTYHFLSLRIAADKLCIQKAELISSHLNRLHQLDLMLEIVKDSCPAALHNPVTLAPLRAKAGLLAFRQEVILGLLQIESILLESKGHFAYKRPFRKSPDLCGLHGDLIGSDKLIVSFNDEISGFEIRFKQEYRWQFQNERVTAL